MPSSAANDPDEPLDVLTPDGELTGRAMPRGVIHAEGFWHRSFHCWILRRGTRGTEVVLQRRHASKDTFPNRWDASAAGHWRAGESAAQAARELGEELGIDVPFSSLEPRGRESVERRHPNGIVDREHQEVYVLAWDAPLATYRPDPREVAGLCALLLADYVGLLDGTLSEAPPTEAVRVLGGGRIEPDTSSIRAAELVPYPPERIRRLLPSGAHAG